MSPILTVEHLGKSFTVPHRDAEQGWSWTARTKTISIIEGASFSIERGEVVLLSGAGGAGKTVLMKLLAGVFPPTSGQIRYYGTVHRLIDSIVVLNLKNTLQENLKLSGRLLKIDANSISELLSDVDQIPECREYKGVPLVYWPQLLRRWISCLCSLHSDSDLVFFDGNILSEDSELVPIANRLLERRRNQGKSIIFAGRKTQDQHIEFDRHFAIQQKCVLELAAMAVEEDG